MSDDAVMVPSIIAPAVREAERIEAGGTIVPSEQAALIRSLADLVADHWEALQEERAYVKGLQQECEEMTKRLERIDHHLRRGIVRETLDKLADYAGGWKDFEAGEAHEDRDDPPRDPYPDPEPAPKKRARRKGGAAC